MIDPQQFRTVIIRPVFRYLGAYSLAAENLAMVTLAAESEGGRYIVQMNDGPARSGFQMEHGTHDDIWDHFLRYRGAGGYTSVAQYLSGFELEPDTLAERVRSLQVPGLYDDANADEMAGNAFYAAAMVRVHYLRRPEPLPRADDVNGLAHYWKLHYNTWRGKGTVDKAIRMYRRYGGHPS